MSLKLEFRQIKPNCRFILYKLCYGWYMEIMMSVASGNFDCTKMYPLILCLVLVDKLQSYFDIFQGWNVVHKKIFIPCNNVTIYKLCYIYIYICLSMSSSGFISISIYDTNCLMTGIHISKYQHNFPYSHM